MNSKNPESKLTKLHFDKSKNVVVIEGETEQVGIVRFEVTPSSLQTLFGEVVSQDQKSPIVLVNEIFQKMSELKADLVQINLFGDSTKIDYGVDGSVVFRETYSVSTGKNIESRLKILAGFPLLDGADDVYSGEINTLEHGVKIKYFAKTKNGGFSFFNIRPLNAEKAEINANITPKSLGQLAEEAFIDNIQKNEYYINYHRGRTDGASAGVMGLPYNEPKSGDVGYNEGWEDGYLREGSEFRRRVYGEEASE